MESPACPPVVGVSITFVVNRRSDNLLEALEYYSVQPILDDGTIDKTNTRNVAAASPLKAAEEATGLSLALVGSRARALVWRMTAGYVPVTITLYDAEPVE